MPVSRGLPLIVVYALYYAILLYAPPSAGHSICTDHCLLVLVYTRPNGYISTHNNLYLPEGVKGRGIFTVHLLFVQVAHL